MAQSTVESKNKKDINNGKIPAKETILSPRFYTCLLYTSDAADE